MIGTGAGATGEIHLGLLMMKRGADPRLDVARAPAGGEGADRAGGRALGAAALADGTVKVPVAETFKLDDAQAAYERFQAGGKLGKIVLVMD